MNDESNLQRRLNIAMEILNTERTYLAGLELIETTFYKPLLEASQSNNPIIESKRIADIFSNLMGILAVNREFLSQLETRLVKNEWCPKNGLIGDIFCQLAPYFRMYSLYVKNFNSALAVISEQMGKSVAFATFLKDKKIVEQCKGLPFESYLILPVQRIPRYKLLIEDLIKRTHSSHVDYDNLVKGLDIVSKAATFVNETIRQHEMFMDMLLIQKSLQGFNENLLIPGRKLIKKGSVYKICRKNHQLRVFFLFSDILIYGSGNPDSDSTLVFHRKVDLEVVKIVDVPDTDNIKNLFQIISQEKSFAAYCDTIKEKQSWLDAFNTTIKELHSNKKTLKLDTNSIRQKKEIILPLVVKDYSAPVWIPDDQAIDCHCCKEEFTVFKRKHHCRLCGNVVCHTCSNNTFFIPGQSLVDHRPARACDKCYKLKFKGENPPPHTSLSALKRYSFLGTGSTSSTSTSNSDLSTSSPIFPPARFPFNAPKRLVELRETINNSRDSYFSDSSSLLSFWTDEDTKNKNNKSNEFNNNNSTNSSLSRLSRVSLKL
ncbi:Dbl homology domain-containing protein [Neoconidiobolus thromboides FSU 785]|nr:Dbl homology domain-containing protein [Neoconidiobolus thromboides FSU 785]